MNVQTKLEPPDTLAGAMAAAFAEIEGATKSANNPHFKTKYADLTSVIEAVKPALSAHGLFFTQHPEPSERGVTIETWLHHAAGESMSLGKLFVPANKQDAQGFGSALTYARRYALVTAFGVPVEDDDGNAASKAPPEPKAAEMPDADWAKLVQLVEATKSDAGAMLKFYKVPDLRKLTQDQYAHALNSLENKLAKAAKAETDAKVEEPA